LEAVVGAAVAAGYRTRTALIAGATLMLVLMFGSALRQDWSTVVIQLTYSLIYCVLLAGAQVDRYCLDHVRSVAPEIAL
jgi:thiosulfate dehydrogenase [quinone] large subunit